MKRLTVLLLLSFFFPEINAQDSLYLVGTITGASTEKNITDISSVGDVNGDGYDDFAIVSRTGKIRKDQGIVQLILGSATLDLTPDVTFHYPCCDSLNNLGNASEIGDVNGDGYDDFTISGSFGDFGFAKGKVFLYYGGETIDTIPVAEFYEPWIQDNFGLVETVRDLNNDGYDDFVIGSSYNWSNGKGYVYLFWGGDTISWGNSTTFTSNVFNDFFGASVSNIGDLNNDGFEDIAIGAPNIFSNTDPGKAYIYFGGTPINITEDTVLTGTYFTEGFGSILNNGGDINHDNTMEFFIAGGAYVYLFSALENIKILNGFEMGIGGYINVTSNCDINNDDYNDFIIGNTNYRNSDSLMVGGAFVYFGNENIDTTYNVKLEGENKWDEFSKTMICEDINGDGFDELFVFAPNYPDYEYPLGNVYIYSYKNVTDVNEEYAKVYNYFFAQNFPNPFNPSTSIQFVIGTRQFVSLKVYDVLGKEIATLVNEEKSAGSYEVEFNPESSIRDPASGVYFYQLRAGDYVETKKMLMIK
jgi:hypothetical protein